MKGKDIAIMILALEKLNWIASALYLAIKNDFGNIGSYQSVNDYYSPYKTGTPKQEKRMLTDDDIKPFISKIKSL